MGIWQGHWGYTPTLHEKYHGIFNDHRESEPRFNVSSERRILSYYLLITTPSVTCDLKITTSLGDVSLIYYNNIYI